MEWCALILHFFIVEHIPESKPNFMAVTNWGYWSGVILQYKTTENMQGVFSGASKQVIMYLISTVDEYHLLVGLEDEQKTTLKKTSSKPVAKKDVKEVDQGSEKVKSSSKFEDLFDVDYSAPSLRGYRKAKGSPVPKYCG